VPTRRKSIARLLGIAAICAVAIAIAEPADADPYTVAYVNGVASRVYFNDGDTFRMHTGPFAGSSARLAGFNTLESYGPAHRWGSWDAYELYLIAKMATLNARRGIWHCTGDGERDGYGRLLLDCPDLAVDQISKGYAHAMTIDDTPARAEYLRVQQRAMRARRGFWAHGVPEFIMTSVHSVDEYADRTEAAKNRMVSTRDGHSERFEHHEIYDECEWVCADEVRADASRVREVASELRADAALEPHLRDLTNILLVEIVDRFARVRGFPAWVPAEARAALEPRLAAANLGATARAPGSCMLYVAFERRYGGTRPACLRGHGDAH
jgi:endonuclease YncB( thermonuclease family)